MPTKLNTQLAEQLPADLIYTIMQYACYKTHPTAKMIKQAVEDKYKIKHIDGKLWDWTWCLKFSTSADFPILSPPRTFSHCCLVERYIEVDCVEMFKEVDNYDLLPSDWFHAYTELYADISEEWRDNLSAYRHMIIEAELHDKEGGDPEFRIAQGRAYELYKIISNCHTMVH